MKAVLISIQPKWVEKIANGEKTIEVRKIRPKVETPFKVYIYMTMGGVPKVIHTKDFKAKSIYEVQPNTANGRVVGEFVCDRIDEFHEWELSPPKRFYKQEKSRLDLFLKESCLTYEKVCEYRENLPSIKPLFGWHISQLKIYDKPKELFEFFTPIGKRPSYMIEKAPQSWCYVED